MATVEPVGAFIASSRAPARRRLLALRLRLWPILQTAAAAVAAWYLAMLVVSEDQPVFASIAAVIALGASYGQRPARAVELVGGVVLGIGVADLLVRAIGSGPLQLGLMVVLAMGVAVLLGGGPLLVTEAAVSAILLVALEPSTAGLAPTRLTEAVVGGGVALAVSALAFPPDPGLMVGRRAQGVFGKLGGALEEVAQALAERDATRAEEALEAARAIDVRALEEALVVGRETARLSPGRRSTHSDLERYERAARHIDFAVRNTRVLGRHAVWFLRTGGAASSELADAVWELAAALWALAAELDSPSAGEAAVRDLAASAAARGARSFDADRDLAIAGIVAQVRSTAIDFMRAAEAGAAEEDRAEASVEELLARPAHAA
jgi:uncharacterized membrane protein YgaE (UPF0421/DUF939 family)